MGVSNAFERLPLTESGASARTSGDAKLTVRVLAEVLMHNDESACESAHATARLRSVKASLGPVANTFSTSRASSANFRSRNPNRFTLTVQPEKAIRGGSKASESLLREQHGRCFQ